MGTLNRYNALAFSVAIGLAASLTACGGGRGGNGNVRPSSTTPSPAPAPPPAPSPAPASGPAPTTLTGSPTPLPTPIIPNYNPLQAQLYPTNVTEVWYVGGIPSNQGQGVKIGIIDSGAQATNPALINRISWFKDYVDPSNTTPQDEAGHGTMMAEIIGGTANADGPFDGGVAPQSSLYIARLGDASGNINVDLAPQALSDLNAQGVKLINNSYGSSTLITSVNAADPLIAQRYSTYSPTAANGQLMVWAAGNNGMSQPSVEAGLPYYEPSLRNNWIAVVNVALNASGQVTGLDTAATSNACGVAASWCLAAPGYSYVSPVSNTPFSTGAGDGTSGSAAVVTGVAALVWQTFPFFSASNVQQTLLGTATNLGSPSFYGNGLVNAAAAVNGPARLDWGVFDVNMPAGTVAQFWNYITGSGTLQIDGDGNLALLGVNNFGGITINGGTLTLESSNTLQNGLTVNGGTVQMQSALTGNVTINNLGSVVTYWATVIIGNVVNGGELTVPNPTRINGNFTVVAGQPANGHVIFTEFQGDSTLTVSGTATLNHSLLLYTYPNGYTPQASQLLLQATGGLIGTFGSLIVNGNIYATGALSYTANDVSIAISQQSVSAVAQASMPAVATTQQTAQHIQAALVQANQWAVTNPAAHQTFLNAAGEFMHVDSLAQAALSINSLSGQLLASSQGLSFEQAGIVNRTVADRLVDLGNGAAQQGAWFQATSASGDIARSGYATGNYNGGGSVAGYDVKVADDFTLGAGLDWNRVGSNYTLQGGNSSSRSTGVMLYGKYADGNAYVSGRIGEDWIHSDTNRWGVLGTVSAPITSARNDKMTSVYLEGGYDVRSDAWTTTPFVSAGDEHLDRGAINEQGAGGFGITAPSDDFNQNYAQIGARLAYRWTWGTGQLSLKGFALYQRVLGGQNLGFTAAYAGAPNAAFELEGVNTPRNTGWVGVGLNAVMTDHWSWFANLDGQVAGGGTKATVFSAGARYRF